MLTCIIVDDEKKARDRLETICSELDNISIIGSLGDPDEAINEILHKIPDIVLLDIEMPGKNGFSVIDEIRAGECFPAFILTTGFEQYTIKAIKNAAFDYLLKPIDIDELRDTINRLLCPVRNSTIKDHSTKTNDLIARLSERENEIFKFIVQGKTSNEIANVLFISKKTVDTHRRNILHKLGLRSSIEIIIYAYKNNLTE